MTGQIWSARSMVDVPQTTAMSVYSHGDEMERHILNSSKHVINLKAKIHLKANTASMNVWLFYPNLNKSVWPLWSYLVVWRKPHSPICWGPLGPQSTQRSGRGSRVKPSHCSALLCVKQLNRDKPTEISPIHLPIFAKNQKYPTLDDLAESQLSIRRICLDLTSSSLCRFRVRKQNTSYICWTRVACGHHLASGLDGKRVSSTIVGLLPLSGKPIPFFVAEFRGRLLEANGETQHRPLQSDMLQQWPHTFVRASLWNPFSW